MDQSNHQPPRNLSGRWKARAGRNLVPAGADPAPRRRRKNDQEPLTREQQELAARFMPLARSLAKPMKELYAYWKDEFESAACMALVEAARSFDPSRNIKFSTFVRFRIRGALADVGRVMGDTPYDEDLEARPGVVTLTPFIEEHGQVLVAVEPPPVGTEFEDIDSVEHLLKRLPRKHATVCRLYYVHGKTQSEIGQELGCSQTEVTRLHKKAIELLSDPYDRPGPADEHTWRRKRGRRAGPAQIRIDESEAESA